MGSFRCETALSLPFVDGVVPVSDYGIGFPVAGPERDTCPLPQGLPGVPGTLHVVSKASSHHIPIP